MYAIIATGGKQYKVAEKEVVKVERLAGQPGDKVNFDRVLMIGGGDNPTVGQPHINGAKVEGEIVAQDRLPKVVVFKKKRRKGFKKTIGHRQYFTGVKITKIVN